uniref:Uncharacterized protein n=1 Tax=Ficedula albicollis TaxID=59894 RepID=A0A803V005_FICAL
SWTPYGQHPMIFWRSSPFWASRRCGRRWSGSCTTSSPSTAPTSTTGTWRCCATP